MTLPLPLLQKLITSTPDNAWRTLIEQTLVITSAPLSSMSAPSEVTRRDRQVGEIDLFLASGGWDLWQTFDSAIERNAERLIRWWSTPFSAKAVLILDGLSLRELPWLLQGAAQRGFTCHEVSAYAAELPGETDEFAHALGFAGRHQLQNNGGRSPRLPSARTESIDLPWRDCANLIDGMANWFFWHHWPDEQLHRVAVAGQGLDVLTRDVERRLNSDEFWEFIGRLATGRRLVITADHGYAATGLFADATGEPAALLKRTFRSRRSVPGALSTGPFVPPVALQLTGHHGVQTLALGRWKWPSQGGYPTLAHGGLSLLEALTPFIELTR